MNRKDDFIRFLRERLIPDLKATAGGDSPTADDFERACKYMEAPFTARELGTVLAALRLWQWWISEPSRVGFRHLDDVATSDGKHKGLSIKAIDSLIIRINR